MNLVLSITGSMITDRRSVIGCINIQTSNSLNQIEFCVDVLHELANIYIYDMSEDLTNLRPDFVELINSYAEMYWVGNFFPDKSANYEDAYQKQVQSLISKLNNM